MQRMYRMDIMLKGLLVWFASQVERFKGSHPDLWELMDRRLKEIQDSEPLGLDMFHQIKLLIDQAEPDVLDEFQGYSAVFEARSKDEAIFVRIAFYEGEGEEELEAHSLKVSEAFLTEAARQCAELYDVPVERFLELPSFTMEGQRELIEDLIRCLERTARAA